jgi:hypothetical protein
MSAMQPSADHRNYAVVCVMLSAAAALPDTAMCRRMLQLLVDAASSNYEH